MTAFQLSTFAAKCRRRPRYSRTQSESHPLTQDLRMNSFRQDNSMARFALSNPARRCVGRSPQCGMLCICGEVAERLMAPLSKSGSRLHRDVGSNPTLSAIGSEHDPSVAADPERCWSGRTGATGNRVGEQSSRGFESHPLRHHICLTRPDSALGKRILPSLDCHRGAVR